MKGNFIDNAFFRILSPPLYGSMIYLLVLLIFDNVDQLQAGFFNREWMLCVVLTALALEGMRALILILQRRIPDTISEKAKIAIQVIATSLMAILIGGGGIYLYFTLVENISSFDTELIIFCNIFQITALLYNMLYFSIIFMNRKNTAKLKEEDVKRKGLEYQLQAFNNEVNSDLLYRSLETLISLLHVPENDFEENDVPEEFIGKLSALYRYILDNKKNELVTLDEEAQVMNHLLYLLNHRFSGQIDLTVALDNVEADTLVIPGTMVAVLEFIVKKTIITSYKSLKLKLYQETKEGYLVLESGLCERLVPGNENQSRFENIRKAYTFFSHMPVMIVKAYDTQYIKIPIIQQQRVAS